MLLFSGVTMLVLYLMQRVQLYLPWNPQKLANVGQELAFNTAGSFTTNTNWQNYAGESTMSYLTQMAGLAYHNFTSAAVGIALAIALIRGIARREKQTIGNFWVDMTRATLWVLVPACVLYAVVLIAQGVPQNLRPYDTAKLVESQTIQSTDASGKPTTKVTTEQTIAQGPVASQEAIKMLGTNGGGFYNVNSAHPFENPDPFSNFVELLSILLIPAALCYTFGRMVKDTRQGWAILAAMTVLFVAVLIPAIVAESSGNPRLTAAGA